MKDQNRGGGIRKKTEKELANTDIQLRHSESNFKGDVSESQISSSLRGAIMKRRLRPSQEESTHRYEYIYIYLYI